MTKPATDEQIALWDLVSWQYRYDALRARLDQEIAARETAECHAASDLEERQYWQERYEEERDQHLFFKDFARDLHNKELEMRKQLAAAVAVVEAASTMRYPAKPRWSEDAQRLHDAIATYRQKYPKETNE